MNATQTVKPEKQNRRLEPPGLTKVGKTHRLVGTGLGYAPQEAAGSVFGQVWNRIDAYLLTKPGPLAVNLHLLLSLHLRNHQCMNSIGFLQPLPIAKALRQGIGIIFITYLQTWENPYYWIVHLSNR
jgi:hypothetical protein